MKHKNAEIIKAWLDGKECEYLGECTNKWWDIKELVTFDTADQVRIKPEPQQEPQYLYVYNHISVGKPLMSPTLMRDTSDWIYLGKVEVIK